MNLFRARVVAVLMAALFAFIPFAAGQSATSQVGPNFYAPNFLWRMPSDSSVAAGAATVTFYTAEVALPDGRRFVPFSTLARLTVIDGANGETVTPTAVSGCSIGAIADSCQVTATFSNAHGKGVTFGNSGIAATSSFGLDEAALAANAYGGGVAIIDGSFGGTNTNITASPWLASYPKVVIGDQRLSSFSYWRAAPGLTAIATPTALTTASTLTTSVTGGSIATATTPRFCITATDFFGGETPCSNDSAGTATLVDGAGSTNSYTITAPAFPTGTGITGYRLYVSASGGATQSETLVAPAQMTFTSAPVNTCPLVGCIAPGTAVILTALPATTAAGPPVGTAGAATAMATAHTTVVAQQVGQMPFMMPFVTTAPAGFFPVTATSAAGSQTMGELPYQANTFNSLGANYLFCFGGVTTPSAATVAGTWAVTVGARQNSAASASTATAQTWKFTASIQWTAAASTFESCQVITTTATGTSATVESHASSFGVVVTATGIDGIGTQTYVPGISGVSGAFDATQQGVIDVTYLQTAASWTVPQIRYMSLTRL